MGLTKEKLVFALALLLGASIVAAAARAPAVEAVPEVPGEEAARPYRALEVDPRLAPEAPWAPALRDPFRQDDPWVEAPPALLAAPPVSTWPRALPVGLTDAPRGPDDVLLVPALPRGDGQ